MDWKDVDSQVDVRRVAPISAGREIEARLMELLFGEQTAAVRAERFLRENWVLLTGSAGTKSVPARLDRGVLIVHGASASAAQEIQMRLLKIKEQVRAEVNYDLTGFRFESGSTAGGPRRADTAGSQKSGSKPGLRTDKKDGEEKKADGEGDAFVADIRRRLGLS